MMRPHHRRAAAAASLAFLLAACPAGGCSASRSTAKAALSNARREFTANVSLHGEALTLHLASAAPPRQASAPLVLYASGDGGWFGAAVGMFRTIAGSGLPAVGFSTKAFMRIEHRWSRPLSVAHVAESYLQIIAAARLQLHLPADAPVVLTGWSRGASLGVLVASSREADPGTAGVVAVGLVADEQLDIEGDSDDDAAGGATSAAVNGDPRGHSIAMYPLLARVAPRRSVVIQASGDGYLPAASARELFGPDSAMKRLVAIEARNHRFGGGESRLAAALVEAVDWVSSGGEQKR